MSANGTTPITEASKAVSRSLQWLPNAFTFARLVLLPWILWLSIDPREWSLTVAALLFALAAFTDLLDGYLARRLHAISRLGTFLDPLVDKAMVLGVLSAFAWEGLLPWWIVLMNALREAGATAIRHGRSTRGRAVGANWMGKTKYILQVLLIEWIYLHAALASRGSGIPGGDATVFWAAVLVTALSFAFLANFARLQFLFARDEA